MQKKFIKLLKSYVDVILNATICHNLVPLTKRWTLILYQAILGKIIITRTLHALKIWCCRNRMCSQLLRHLSSKRKIIKYIKGEAFPWWWEEETMYPMRNNAGFFSATPELLKRFSEMMIEDMPLIDILASWRFEEEYFSKELQNAYKIDFEPYNPFWSDVPWTAALENKKVLVVHPFAETIQKQYLRKELIHKDPRVLPTFDLQTIKAIQTIGNQGDGRFETWFDALEFMKNEIDKMDYDVCLLGCGAYGMPLAAHVKRSGKRLYT